MSGHEKSKHAWKEIHNMIYESFFNAVPEEMKRIKEEINKILDGRPNVCETDKRDND